MAKKKDDFTDFFCKLSKIGNLPKCFMFYIIDILVGVWFLIWGALAKIFSLQNHWKLCMEIYWCTNQKNVVH